MTSLTSYQRILAVFAVLAIAAMFAMFTANSASAKGKAHALAVTGITSIDGEPVLVHVITSVQAGKSHQEIAAAALRGVGARELTSSEYSLLENSWDQFSDGIPGNDFVTQRYNPKDEATGALDAIESARATWTAADSPFAFEVGMEITGKCPSLVDECKGRQNFDGFNDIGWVRLRDSNTLAVAWSGTTTDESDVAFNTRFSWSTDIPASATDIETVALHELGHVAGIGHSDVDGSIMEAVYAGVRRTLTDDDIAALQAHYGSNSGGTEPTPTVDPGPDPTPTATPTPVPPGTELHVGSPGYSDGDGVTYSTSGRKGRDLIITVQITDGSAGVGGASVSITASNSDSGYVGSGSGNTDSSGEIRFRIRNADAGNWSTTVNSSSTGSQSCSTDCPDGPHTGVK